MYLVMWIGVAASLLMLAMLGWSILYPQRRLWPPKRTSALQMSGVWAHTLLMFGCGLYLGIADWNSLGWSTFVRWGVGLPLILVGNLVVWTGVGQLGFAATSGEVTALQVEGLYRFSRNPQYVADVAILVGWAVLTASLWALPVVALGIVILVVAPFAEEPWLSEAYGEPYEVYRRRVRRYL